MTNHSFFLLFLLDDFPDFGELDEFVNGFEGHPCVLVNLLIVDHFVHVVGGDWSHDVLSLLVIPDLSVLVKSALVDLIEVGKGTCLVVLFLLLHLLLVLRLADKQNLLLLHFTRCLLLVLGFGLDVEVIGVVQILSNILRCL